MSKEAGSKTVCVVGLGYIGLPTACMFATHGHRVHGVDNNPSIVESLSKGIVHIKEPGLATVVKGALNSGNLKIDSKPAPADVFILAVPTPHHHEPGQTPAADMSFVKSAMESILPHLKKGNLVILESTSPPGTTQELIVPMIEKAGFVPGKDIGAAYCPERVIPGQTMKELITNDRVIGALNESWGEYARQLYKSFVSAEIFLTEPTVAEMVKLIENTYRDVNIAFANEMAILCEKLKINVWDVINLANRHPRVNVHKPGPGVGGHCISVDPWCLVEKFPKETPLVSQARHTNDAMPERVVEIIKTLLNGKRSGKITILGIAYKANVDDARESPAISVIKRLKEICPSFEVLVYDPFVKSAAYPGVPLKEALQDSDLAVLLTAHDEFKLLDPVEVGGLMKTRLVFDTHNVLKAERWVPSGFTLKTLGDGGSRSEKKVGSR